MQDDSSDTVRFGARRHLLYLWRWQWDEHHCDHGYGGYQDAHGNNTKAHLR